MNHPNSEHIPEGHTFVASTEDMDIYYRGSGDEYIVVLPPEYGGCVTMNIGIRKSAYPETSHKLHDICSLHHNLMV